MVDQAARQTNPSHVHDFVSIIVNPSKTDPATLKDLYLGRGLSAAQVAAEIGLSKTAVIERLHNLGIRRTRRGRDPDNYQFPKNPPYGYRVKDGRLVPDRQEMKTARRIVESRDRQNLGWRVIAEQLNAAGLWTRKGCSWNIDSARSVYERWRGRL